MSTIHVDNVVEAVQCALERGTGGRPVLRQRPRSVTFRDFVAGLAEVDGLSIDGLRSVPYRIAFTLGLSWKPPRRCALTRVTRR